MINPPKFLIPGVVIFIITIIIIAKSSVTIGYGEAGVLFKTFGGGVEIDNTLDEGFNVIAPWNNVTIYNVKQQELLEKGMEVLSSNGLAIKLDASVLYQPKFEKLGLLHKTRGKNYLENVITPAVRSATRSVVGRYTPEQLYSSKRDAIQDEIFEETRKILEPQYVQLNAILVRDVTLPAAIKDAIERKLRQEQESLEYEFRLTKASKEAQKQIIEAQGKADANRILSASLTDKILQDKGIDATLQLAASPNAKVVIVGGKDGLPIILGNN
ncbi:MAG: peptidase [Flavobacteriales bacterium CG_4_9_14_0_2_um_filter_35_242]|nr:prohibitin family protein [Zetaproteobacteria bacterium]NDK17748.1 prohibitin family protein [Flavobacteriales bacterium]OIO09388.1 MAG: peptidase [Flavobacteriaceae bacterium CG1_02_35_72]PIR14382.1 MAG: peptidase [Flavobacteriales bacterium CG11_big_fil_rev_8_21_14_0_20_35_7]PIV17456.1 MAG: peptidase [Flavobacteriales bacterium CG03_land_8_20_14_0_80_35_15]PIX06429.1 MAG: peptidase [Flavobacteriales bacterium CG_4_8_14_3_um_filter_35_10]PJA06804.1 MAG: peptidase [Flavobacteriales bacteri